MNVIGGNMSVYDVLKDEAVVEIKSIRFMEDDSIKIDLGKYSDDVIYGVKITEGSGDYVTIEIKDLPNLIRALQKAQELWGYGN